MSKLLKVPRQIAIEIQNFYIIWPTYVICVLMIRLSMGFMIPSERLQVEDKIPFSFTGISLEIKPHFITIFECIFEFMRFNLSHDAQKYTLTVSSKEYSNEQFKPTDEEKN